MRLACEHVRVRVPATSANLGPGFDTLGLALGRYDTIDVRVAGPRGVAVRVSGEGSADLPAGEDHLIVRAVRAALDHVGAPQVGLDLTCTNVIPHGRGMGSSAAAVVAGIVAARMLVEDPEVLDDAVALRLATDLEGHPDNAAPALFGGMTVAWSAPDGPRAVAVPVHPDIDPVVLVPDVRCATRTARGVLPATVPHTDAAFTAGRAALLVHALSRQPDVLLDATADRLHQDYRASVMRPTWDLVQALRAQGQAAVVSGAGPSVLVLERQADHAVADGVRRQVLEQVTARSGEGDWQVLTPGVSREGAVGERL